MTPERLLEHADAVRAAHERAHQAPEDWHADAERRRHQLTRMRENLPHDTPEAGSFGGETP
jgi:hypothetical protein